MKRLGTAFAVVVVAALACDQPVEPPGMGSIRIAFAPANASPSAAAGGRATPPRPRPRPDEIPDSQIPDSIEAAEGAPLASEGDPGPTYQAMALTGARIVVSGPQTNIDDTITVGSTGGSAEYDSLPAGTFTVKVWGLVGTEVEAYGEANNVSVSEGQATTVNLASPGSGGKPWGSVRPALRAITPATTTSFVHSVHFGPVTLATGYTVEWSASSGFSSGVQSRTLTDTITTITVADTGRYYVRARATVAEVPNPRWSDTVSARVVMSTSGGSSAGGAEVVRAGIAAVDTTIQGLNLFSTALEDWFALDACRDDTLRIETRAQRLNPPSPLNTLLRLYQADGTTQVASNDNLATDTTDSRIQVVVSGQGSYRIQVTQSGGTTGHYELAVVRRPGPENNGTSCAAVVSPSLSTISVSPASVAAGGTSTFRLVARDTHGGQMSGGGLTVVFSLSGGTSNGAIGAVADSGNGVYTATFTGQTAGTASTVNATVNGVAVTSTLPTITVTATTLAKLGFTIEPSSATAGTSIAPTIEVAAQDAFGNLISGASGIVTMAILNNPATGTLFGSVSKPLVSGVARFDDLKIDKAADGYTLRATSGSLTAATSGGFSIVAGAAQRLAFILQPSNATGGDSIQPGIQVAVRDAYGNTVTGFSTSINLLFGNNPGAAALGGTLTRNTVSGVATFDDVNVNKIANGYTLKAGTPLLDSATSSAFNVSLGPPKRLVFTVEPGDAGAGEILAPAVKVTVTDNGGNTVTTAADSVAMEFGLDPTSGAATLSGTKKVKPVAGVATFNNLSIDKSAAGYALRATAGAVTPDTTSAFDILPGVPAKLAFQVQPANVGAGSSIAPSVEVVIQDGFSNPVTSAANFVTVAIGTNPPGDGALDGTVTKQAVGGVATFSDLTLDKVGTGYTLTASSSSLLGATSVGFNVTASVTVSGSQSSVNASPGSGVVADNADSATITVTVRDPTGNPMQGQTVAFAATGSNNTITQPSGPTNASGVASGAIKSTRAEVKTITATVNPGASQVVLTQQPTVGFVADTANVSASLSTVVAVPVSPDSLPNDGVQQSAITVTVVDVNGNPVPDRTVDLATNGTGTLTQPGATDASGVAVGGITSLTAGNNTITATVDPAGSNVVLSTQPVVKFFTAPCGMVNALQSTVTATQDTIANGADPVTVTVTVKDCGGALLANRSVRLTVSGTGNSVTPSGSTLTDGSGVATFALRSTVAQSKTVTAIVNPVDSQVVLSQKPTVVFKPGAAAGLAYRVQPGTTAAGAAFSPAVQVAVVDAFGNTVDTATSAITIALNPAGPTLFGTTTVSASGGVATFGDLSIQAAATGYTLTASAAGFADAVSGSFTITSAAASALAFSAQPAAVAAGASISPAVAVTVVDQYGNPVTSASTSITLAIGNNGGVDSAGVLSGTKTKTAVSGVASYTNLNINRAGPAYTLTAAASGLTGATSAAFNVTPGAPFQLRFKVEPTTAAAGATIAPAVQVGVQDAFGNTVDTVASNVTVSFYTDPTGAATLGGTTTQPAVAGIATFGNLNITKAASGYRLRATQGSLTQGLSATFNINPAAAFRLSFTSEPQTTAAGNAISPAPQVTVQDAHGNTVTGFADSVAVAILANPGAGALSGTTKVVPTLGVSTFSTLSIDKVGTGYTLTTTAPGVGVPDTSVTFNITSAPVAKVGFVVEPTTATAGTAIAPSIQVAVQDALGNPVPGTTNAITLAILANPGGATIIGTSTVAAVDGIATFSNVALDKAGTGYTFEASATGLAKDTSAAFNVTAGASNASTSTVSANPTANVAADGAQTSTITVTVRDAFGNPASGRSVTLASSGSNNTITQPVDPTNASGVTTGTIATTAPETKTITATADGSVVIAQQATATFIPAVISPTLSTVAVNPTELAADGVTSATITVTVRSNDGTPVASQTVQLAVSGSGNAVTQPAAVTDGSGVATGSVTSTFAEIKTITATVNPGAGQSVLSQQPTVTFKAGPPAQVGFKVQPSNVAAGAPIAPSIEVAIQDAQGNTVDTAISNVTLAIAPGTGTLNAALYGTLTQAASGGIATFANIVLDSVGTGYRLQASSGSLTPATSTTFDVAHGLPYTVTVSPTTDSIYILGDNATFTAVARDSVGNLIPEATFAWGSSNDPVAIVDAFGTVTAVARGLSTISASTGGKTGTADVAVAIRIAQIVESGSEMLAPSQLFTSGDIPGRLDSLTAAEFTAIGSPAALRAAYDVLLFTVDALDVNADWATVLRPYLALGGGVLFENVNNTADLSPAVTASFVNLGTGTLPLPLLPVPGLTDGITNDFVNSHLIFTGWNDTLAHFMVHGDTALGLYGRFGNGCIVLTGPDQGWHGNRGGTAQELNLYNFLLNEVRFAADCPLNGTPGTPASVRVFPKSLAFTDVGQNQQLRATALDAAGTPVPGASITWFTLNDSVATVDGTGLVTSVRDGQAHIGASGSGADYSVATIARPAIGGAVNAWGTEVPQNALATSFLIKIWGPASNNLFAVGDGGQILRFNGTDWDSLPAPAPNRLWGVWGFSDTSAYAVGDNGLILHWNGAEWTSQTNPAVGSQLSGVWGSGPNNIWVVGVNGRILHSGDGTTWQDFSTGTASLWAVWGTSWNDVWAVGDGGTILHYDGVSWTGVLSPVTHTLSAVGGSGPDNIFAVGWYGPIARYNGTSWVSQAAPELAELWGVWASSANEAIAVGRQAIFRYNGATWSKMAHAAPDYVLGVWGTAGGQLRAVGSVGEVFRGVRGATIDRVEVTPSGASVYGVSNTQQYRAYPRDVSNNVVTPASFSWGTENGGVATINATGLATSASSGQTSIRATADGVPGYGVLTVNVTGATAVNLIDSTVSPTPKWWWAAFGTASNNVFLGGRADTIIRYNGSTWSITSTPGGLGGVRGIWGSSATDLWAVTDGGYILRSINSTTWVQAYGPAGAAFYGVWGAAPNDVWAVATNGNIFHYDGISWSLHTDVATGLYGIWGASHDTVYAVGGSGTVLRYNGTAWEAMTTPSTGVTLQRVWGASGRDVFAVGLAGTIWRYQSGTWNEMMSNTAVPLYGVWGTSSNDVYAMGGQVDGLGTVLRFNGSTWAPLVSRTVQPLYTAWGTNTGNVWFGAEAGNVRRGVRGGAISASQQITFVDPIPLTKMSIAWDSVNSRYYTASGGAVSTGYVYAYNSAGIFVDSQKVNYDIRGLVRRGATYYVKDYSLDWYTHVPLTSTFTPVFADGFTYAQSSPAVTLLGAGEIFELATGGTIRRLNPSGALLGTLTGITSGGAPSDGAIATDGYYFYTWSHSTSVVYVYSRAGVLITSLTLPAGPTNGFSLSFANGMLWASSGTNWYGYRLNVTP